MAWWPCWRHWPGSPVFSSTTALTAAGGGCHCSRPRTGWTSTALLFGLYALGPGRARLRRPANALALLALALAVGSGKLMQEEWLRQGELQQVVYSVHLLAWLLLAAAVLGHLGGVLQLGGVPMARSMFHPALQRGDHPHDWPSQLGRWFRRGR